MYCIEGECKFSSNFEGKTKKYHLKKGDILLHKAHNGIKNYKVNCNNLKLITIDIYINEIINNNLKLKNIEKINAGAPVRQHLYQSAIFQPGAADGVHGIGQAQALCRGVQHQFGIVQHQRTVQVQFHEAEGLGGG